MSRNSASARNSFPSNFSIPSGLYCYIHETGSIIFTTFNITHLLLLLPLCIFILHHGLQLWRQKRSTSSAATVSHSDCFTYHMVAMELVGVFGDIVHCFGNYRKDIELFLWGMLLLGLTLYGQSFFHILTCVERYLAVVHPITYLSLRNQRGIRIRNISIACVWLLSFAGTGLTMIGDPVMIVILCLVFLSLIIISFCSLSVLCVLIRPGPGEQGGGRERIDQSKLRAFYTIVAILGVLLVKFIANLILLVLTISQISVDCVILVTGTWFNLPSNLVLPLLFLHRAGKLVCWKKNNQ